MQFQTKDGINDGALLIARDDSQGIVSCIFIFHVADLHLYALHPFRGREYY